jgi:hypothetical protein
VKVTTKPTQSGEGFVIRVDGKAAAWVSASGGSTIGRKYRAELGDEPVPDDVRAAIERARKKVRARKEER